MSTAQADQPRFGGLADKFRSVNATRNGRRLLIALGSIAATAALGFGLLRTDLFAVERIDISGTQRLERSDVLKKAGLETSMPIMSVNESAIEARLEADPWVEDAVVKSSWPHDVSVQLTERRPLLLAQTTDQKWAELGAGGVVLSTADQPVPGLPVALGATVDARPGARLDRNAQTLVQVSAALPESMRPQVTQMQQDQSGIRLGLASGLIVIVGSADDLGAKLTAAASVLRDVDTKATESLDVSSPSMPVTTPRVKTPPTTAALKQPATTTEQQARSNTQSQRQPSIEG